MYLSTATIDARDRIGVGPWRNANGEIVSMSVDALHSTPPSRALLLNEFGEEPPLETHDVLTGSDSNGRSFTGALRPCFAENQPWGFSFDTGLSYGTTCDDWTASQGGPELYAIVGHTDWDVPGVPAVSRSWNSSHVTRCSLQEMEVVLGNARFYCFARAAGSCPR